MSKFRGGKTAGVSVNNEKLNNNEWSADEKGDVLDTSNFESEGHPTQIIGFVGCSFSLKGGWDANATPFVDPPGLFPRDDLDNLDLYVNRDDLTAFSFPVATIESGRISVQAKTLVTYDVSGMSNGVYTRPAINN